ncbi:MAG: CotH kinase family protein, partial [Candidatus Omnitrophica bacterium]|nr:CotH kinase family protein [Candidatus Omnitrophota bacterium]
EFIELHNFGTNAVDLNGWRLEVGIDYIFEGTSVIEPGGFLILARSAAGFMTAFPAFNGNLIGEFDRNLGNGGDRIDLRDGAGQLIDTVSYLDEAPWPEEADGNGPSLELIHPRLDNSQPESWRSSLGSPTPGSENSVYQSNPRPIISEVKHTPLAPKPSESIRILARISDNEIVSNAHVYWRVAAPTETVKARFPPRTPNPTTQPAGFAEVPLFDDGAHGDGLPGDGLFGATLPPQPDKAVIEFTLTAADASGQFAQFPEGSPDRNALIQVDSAAHPENIPLFRIVMTPRDLETLRTRGVFNNELLNCTLIAQGGAFYQQGIRYRGSSSRVLGPRESFRIEIGENQTFAGLTELNFNGNGTLQQTLAWDLFAASEISNPFRQVFNLVLNNDFYPNYFQIESIDTPFLETNFGDDHGGNLYRGVEDASLEYLGPDPTPYRVPYEKKNNRAEDDYSDLIALTQTFSLESDAAFTEEIQSHIDVRQWLKYFAINSVLANSENGIQLNSGDDYFLYRREEDNRFVILPWDLDGTFGNIGELLFRQKLPAIVRLVQNPDFVRLYYLGIEQALDGPFYPDVVERLVDAYRGVFTNQELDGILFIETARRNFLLNQYPRDLTVEFPDGEIESVESCPRAVLSQDSIRLGGTSHAAYTVAVRVNGAT